MPTREQLEKLLAAEPDDVFLNFGLAMELSKSEPKDLALQRFQRVIDLNADYTAAYYQKGRMLLEMGHLEQAIEKLQEGYDGVGLQ